jgi:hypothetical protein
MTHPCPERETPAALLLPVPVHYSTKEVMTIVATVESIAASYGYCYDAPMGGPGRTLAVALVVTPIIILAALLGGLAGLLLAATFLAILVATMIEDWTNRR